MHTGEMSPLKWLAPALSQAMVTESSGYDSCFSTKTILICVSGICITFKKAEADAFSVASRFFDKLLAF